MAFSAVNRNSGATALAFRRIMTILGLMTKSPPSPAQLARNERMRTAAIEGAKARADIEARDVAIRKNMERLRALRLAKEAEEAAKPKPAKPVKASARGKKAAPKQTAKLSDFLASQRSTGRTT
ncbi:hypothetical protein Nwi_2376 [Nitrobacter winogradskyi Nb-255]|uniref:Uncharacterized protein n=2 Tax=Nitrobacter winogradskyi TaxID=913 RepID=Q3SQ11_NITWN|nr:hypothetical protein Nwi_2376 [Nitrobacter winogradskyi Nb-255]